MPKRLAETITREEEAALLHACVSDRDRLAIAILLGCGLRPGELCGLRIEDCQLHGRHAHLQVRRGDVDAHTTKDSEERVVPLLPALARRLRAFIAARPETVRREVFLSHRRDARGRPQPLTVNALQGIFERLDRETGIHCPPYYCRHTWATRAADAGVPMPQLKMAGGWSSPEMVERYYHGDRQAMLENWVRIMAS